jgi:hypothetical protein
MRQRIIGALLLPFLLAGCGGKSTITNYDKDGLVTSVEELTIDGAHAKAQQAVMLELAKPIPCEKLETDSAVACTAINMGRMIAAAGGAFEVKRGMNDNEAFVGTVKEIKESLPAVGLLSGVRYLAKRPNSVQFNGDGNAYLSSDPVGQGNVLTAPLFSPPTTITYPPMQ